MFLSTEIKKTSTLLHREQENSDLAYTVKIKLKRHKSFFISEKNIIDSPLCLCGKFESSGHFLMGCQLYKQYRNELLDASCGNPNVSEQDNAFIFETLHEFIIKSKHVIR